MTSCTGSFPSSRPASRAQKREWLIVYTSDHGEMMGDHYLFRKCEPYEGSARIPMLICASQGLGFKSAQSSGGPVCLEDLMPTLLEVAGAQVPAGVDGRSLVPILRGEKQSVREVLHGEHASNYGPQQENHYLTDGHLKYIWRPASGREQLFDLDEDPQELHDLATGPGASDRVSVWRKRLIERLGGRPEGFTDGQRLIAGRAYPRVMPHLKLYTGSASK